MLYGRMGDNRMKETFVAGAWMLTLFMMIFYIFIMITN